MELHVAIAAYRERIKHVLSQTDPEPTDDWIRDRTEELMAPFEGAASNGNGLSRSAANKKRSP